MKNTIAYFLFGVFFALMLNATGQTHDVTVSSEDYVKGKIRIKLKREHLQNVSSVKALSVDTDGTTLGVESIDKVNRKVGIKRIKRVFPFSLKNEMKHREYGLHLWFELDFNEGKAPDSVVNLYKVLDEVEIAKPVFKKVRFDGDVKPVKFKLDELKSDGKNAQTKSLAHPNAVGVSFNDPLLPDQWHYENDGSIGTENVDIDLTKAWKLETGKSNVIVAIVDEGIDLEHEDLRDNLWINEAELNGEDGVDDDQNGYVDDFHGFNFRMGGVVTPGAHGTHVAGTVGAVSNNGIGVAGVAGGDGSGNGVRMMSCQVFDDRANGGANFAAAIVYGADNGAVISQNSWGYNQPGYYEPEVLDAVRYFIAEAGQYEGSPMKGGVLFFAAGNTGKDERHMPGAFDEVIAVTSTGPGGYPAPYSTYGDWTDIAAPGGDQSNFSHEGGVLSTLPGDEYGYMQGTSMACPHVSGVAALVVSKFGGDGFRAEDLEKMILGSTNSFTFDHQEKYGRGMLNAVNALAVDDRIAPEQITDLQATDVFHNEVRLQWTVPIDEDNFQPAYFYLAIGQSEITAQNFDKQTVFKFENPYEAGAQVSTRLGGLLKKSNYWFAIKSGDRYENISDISNIIKVTTSDAPHFMESTREIEFAIDVTEKTTGTAPMTFSNIGEGIVYWNSFATNESQFWVDLEEWNAETAAMAEEAAASPELFATTSSNSKPLEAVTTASIDTKTQKHWENDNTVFVAGMSYEEEYGSATLMGTGSPNAGLILATRFYVESDYAFNLTHLEAAMYPQNSDQPIMVEIKKGSEDLQEAETVYVQEYYPDTVNVFKYHRVPIYRPQRFEDDEFFWVVLHYPKEETYPQAMQLVSSRIDYTGYFMVSPDNGLNYKNAYSHMGMRVVPMLRALSTGNDGSYVFMDPAEGQIAEGKSQNVNVVVDVANLSNGNHLASLGIRTNDIHKPGVSIDVKVTVSGQEAEVEKKDVYRFDVGLNVENKLEVDIKNSGLGDLEIYDIQSDVAGYAKDFKDTIVLAPSFSGVVPILYTPSVTGLLQEKVKLITNIGELVLAIEMVCAEAPEIEVSLDQQEVNVASDQTAELELTLKNIGKGSILEYDLEHYNRLNLSKGVLPEKLNYRMISSDEPEGPVANQWDDISAFGDVYDPAYIWLNRFDLEMQFPFYSSVVNHLWPLIEGELYFYQYGNFGNDTESLDRHIAKGLLAPLKFSDVGSKIEKMTHYAFGDREVFSFDMNLKLANNTGVHDFGKVSYQIVLFRNGAIEYRYKSVENITDEMEYIVGVQGLERDDYQIYRNEGEINKKVHNGLVIRFEPINDVSFLVTDNATKGTLAEGESTIVKLTVDPSLLDVKAGTYNHSVAVKSNAGTKVNNLPLTVNVTGVSSFEVKDSLKFGEVNIGQQEVQYAKVSNIGADKGAITGISFNSADFLVQKELPISVNSSSEYQLPVKFAPTSIGAVNTSMTLDFANGDRVTVILTGSGKADPEYVLNIPSSISVDLKGGESVRVPFSISNQDKGVDLDFSFQNSVFASVETDGIQKGAGNNEDFVSEKYGYTWKVSDSLKIFHKWDDISADAELLRIEHGKQKAIKLPFQFPFYGDLYDTIWVSKNGYVTVIEPEDDQVSIEFKKDDGLRGMIAPFATYLVPSTDDGGVMLRKEADRIYVQWDSFIGEDSNGTGGAITFQLEMLSDGSINFHYKDVEKWVGVLQYGLESPDETETVETPKSWILSWSVISDNMTIAIAPPLKGQMISGGNRDFDLVVSAERIYHSGTYQDTVELYSNSRQNPVQRIPLSVKVTGEPILVAPEKLEWTEAIFSDDCKLKRKVKLYNKGYETLSLTKIGFEQLDGLTLYDQSGKTITQNSAGTLLKAIEIEPWCFEEIELEIPVAQKQNVNGIIHLTGNMDPAVIAITATIVDSPVFAWNAEDQEYNLNNTKKELYTFTIENQGETTLSYDLFPAVIPSGESEQDSIIVEEVGNYQFDKPTVVDSLALDTKDVGDGVFTPMVVASPIGFANEFVAPEGGFFLTHVKSFLKMKKLGEYVRVMIYTGGDDPQSGKKIYQQDFVIDKFVEEEWIHFALEQPVTIPEGEKFFVMVCPPADSQTMGFDISSDPSKVKKAWSGPYQAWREKYSWSTYPNMQQVWKIRPLTAAGNGQWIELDQFHGMVEGGASVDVTATIDPVVAGMGTHKAKIFVSTNDVNHRKDEATINLNVNGAPELKFSPNQYVDTVKMQETEELVVNYLFQDPEGENMTISMEAGGGSSFAKMTQTGGQKAQVVFKTNYQSAGVYSYPVAIEDEAGNITRDTILLQVNDKNRAPVMNPDFGTIHLNLVDPMDAFTIDPAELFTDPDGDDLQILAANYTPDIVDLALGYNYIDIHPLAEGTGFLVFGADDGKENGFVVYGVYVIVINDPDAVNGAPDGLSEEDEDFMESAQSLSIYPNPVVDQSSTVQFKLDENADARFEIYNLIGRKLNVIQENNLNSGVHRKQVDFTQFGTGIYICTYLINGKLIESKKVVVK